MSESHLYSIVKLLPFLTTVVLYFVLSIPKDQHSILAICVKCAPIFSLIFFVAASKGAGFSRKIIAALVFSSIGDAFLVWPGYFTHGMAAFGAAQLTYVTAFGFTPLRLFVGIALYAVGILFVLLLKSNLTGIMLYALPVYATLLATMVWRAIARAEKKASWPQLLCSIGAILFMISDTTIAIDRFYTRIPNGQILIMATYYVGQLGIALSILDTKRADGSKKEKKSGRANKSK